MKKLFSVFAMAALVAACGGGNEAADEGVVADTAIAPAVEAPAAPAPLPTDTMGAMPMDTGAAAGMTDTAGAATTTPPQP